MENKINDLRISKNDKNGFEVHFKPLKLGAYVALAIGLLFILADYVLFLGLYKYGELNFLLHNPLQIIEFIAMKIGIVYLIYLAIYTFMSDYIIKLDKENLSKFSAPIPRLGGNKKIKRNSIESYEVKKLKTTSRVNRTSYVRITQIYYNLHIKLKDGKEVKFFTSLTNGDSSLIKRLLDEHINL